VTKWGYIPINGTRFNERQETGTGQLSLLTESGPGATR
jgi:hypothetical protein